MGESLERDADGVDKEFVADREEIVENGVAGVAIAAHRPAKRSATTLPRRRLAALQNFTPPRTRSPQG